MRTSAPTFPQPEKPPKGWYRGLEVQKKPRIPVPGQATPPEGGLGSPAGETGPERCPLGSGIALVLALGSPFIPSHCLAWGQRPERAGGAGTPLLGRSAPRMRKQGRLVTDT